MYLYYFRKYLATPELNSPKGNRFKDDKEAIEQSTIFSRIFPIKLDDLEVEPYVKPLLGISKDLYTDYDYAYSKNEMWDYLEADYMKNHPWEKELPPRCLVYPHLQEVNPIVYGRTVMFLCEVRTEKEAIHEATKFMMANNLWLKTTNIYTKKVFPNEWCLFIEYSDSFNDLVFALFNDKKDEIYCECSIDGQIQRIYDDYSKFSREYLQAKDVYIPKRPDQFMKNYYASKTYLSKYFKSKREPEELTHLKYRGLYEVDRLID